MRHLLLLALMACGTPSSGALRALTYNVHGLPDTIANTQRPASERMPLIAPLLEDWDIVGLQEDWDPVNHTALVATSHPIHHYFDTKASGDKVYGAGLTILARGEPEVGYDEEHYADCYGTIDGAGDCFASKGFQRLSLPLGDGVLDVYNTHHEAGSGPADLDARHNQVGQVLAALSETDHAVLLLGDFNLHDDDPEDQPELDRYAAAGLRDACEELACPESHIDRIYLRDGAGLVLAADRWLRDISFVDEAGDDLSDHPAIGAELTWRSE